MDEFNRCCGYPKILKLRELTPGKYELISLRKIKTVYGDCVIAKLDVYDDEIEYFLAKKSSKLSDEALDCINKGNFVFHYIGYIDGKYQYELESS